MAAKDKTVEDILGSPVHLDMSENALRIRRNLLAVSSIAVFIAWSGLSLSADSSILGIKFVGLSDRSVKQALTVIIIYFFIHYSWYAFDAVLEWRLRITGMKETFFGSFGEDRADYPREIRQSSLYNWWTKVASNMEPIEPEILRISQITKPILEGLQAKANKNKMDGMVLEPAISELIDKITALVNLNLSNQQYMKRVVAVFEDPRITTSLSRFDNWFEFFIKSQNLRFLINDIVLPIGLSLFAIIYLILTNHSILDFNQIVIT